VLPAEGFEQRLRAMGRVAVLFTADWCGFCRRFEPAFTDAARRGAPGLAFAVADISDDAGDPRWDAYGIQVVPTVVCFERGEPAGRLDGILGKGIAPRDLDVFVRRAHAP
jgi:thioredoxin-like negative regulator of GroEL